MQATCLCVLAAVLALVVKRGSPETALLLVLGASETVGQGTTLTTEELASMEPKDLLTRFCLETAGYQPDADEIELFLQALREAGEEDVQ